MVHDIIIATTIIIIIKIYLDIIKVKIMVIIKYILLNYMAMRIIKALKMLIAWLMNAFSYVLNDDLI